MYYGWHNITKILHEERLKQLSRDYTSDDSVWIRKVQQVFIRLWSIMISPVQKAKRQELPSCCQAQHIKTYTCTQIDTTC